ncbi:MULTISPECIES: LysR substrate-binding domain-containing protein [Caballeronia]|uniref:LysR family transcriptional regulator n=1 Tax=Caballeronia zhejiangensis TaxID=871203 RepID=A0A656QIA5_9BURK|nr:MULTISPECIES: LysR substrate-binding domain-containing protein [Caballeronia]EKS66336.1 LysR family transcriptional regulator [Burkholderia sp. SJ98]KDR28020.1 LysR family transcriptional regulator [Caballeronia zhejiangensis]MDR5789100.1 LysR substrate-binding domain-containing protein [Caballeronia sp. LP003]
MDLTLTQLRMFVAVADAGSVRAAARRLDVAPSGITQQLQKLEAIAGGPLFERDVRGARLTPIGERLRVRADLILGECRKTEDEMRQLRGELTGRVALGLAAEATMRLFPALLASYRERCPRIDVHLTSATSRMLTSWVRDGSLDFALALIAPGADIHDMETTPLFDSDVAVIARRGHPLARSRALADLQNAEWVSTRQRGGGAPANKLSALFEHAKLAPPRIAATTEAVFDTLHCLASSDYLGLEPASLTGHPFFREHVEIVPIAERAGRTPVCLLRRAGVPLTPAAQELATMAVSYARMLPTQRDA